MRHSAAALLAVFAMLTQIGLGVTTPLGVVFCVGETHAAVEVAGDDCCAAHGRVIPTAVPTIERACCSDIPLHGATTPVADGPRASNSVGAMLLGSAPVAVIPLVSSMPPPTVASSFHLASPVDRSVLLRV